MKLKISALIFFVVLLTVSCVTGPVYIPENLSPPELIQRGQEASDRNRFANAIQFYETLIERFPNDIDYIIAAEYEIAFIYYRRGQFDEARPRFNAILERYNAPYGVLLPPQFRVLSLRLLEIMDEIESDETGRLKRQHVRRR